MIIFHFLDSDLILHINGKIVSLLDIGITSINEIQNTEDFIALVNKIQNIKCCKGAVSSYEYPDVKDSFGPNLVETHGQWRHKNCLTILPTNDRLISCISMNNSLIEINELFIFYISAIYVFGVIVYYTR